MDALIAKADAIQPLSKKRKFNQKKPSGGDPGPSSSKAHDQAYNSIAKQTSLPKSLRPTNSLPDGAVPKHNHIANKKLRAELVRTSAHIAHSKAMLDDAELLLTGEAGKMEVEGDMERTWRVAQTEIEQGSGQEAAKGRRELKLEGGPYRSRYTRNGRFLHDHTYFAVAQKKYVFIYDRDGVELHCLKSHIEPTRLEFLPYHWLLASIGNAGYLKYQDTSTGQLLVEHRTKFGSCTTMTQNMHNAVIHLGHQNGLVTLWTPNLPHPAVQLLSHLGPVSSVSVDPSSGGRYMATAGKDGTVKVWDCRNWKGTVREWSVRGTGEPEVEWSQKGYLAVASGGSVNIYTPPSIYTPLPGHNQPPLYLTHPITSRPLTSLRFAPFQDILTIGHSAGISSILVPGAGEANFDSAEADPFENKKARREKEVKNLLDKIQPDMITLDPDFVGGLAPVSKLTTNQTHNGKSAQPADVPFARLSRMERLKVQGKADETEIAESDDDSGLGQSGNQDKEERERRKMRGKGKSLKRYLRKQRKNVIDPAAVAIRAKLEKQKQERKQGILKKKAEAAGISVAPGRPSALDRFKRSDL
ncbi:putative U3 small nucleolar RNA-associated protein 7 [Marasmius crinis-equi]|uniref:U3 small nucleolar RNA-associated protein 7 n=1 Tax=Marasmius crinis-equi TaxID=585013 RepID=A0ABR3FQ14_9AGAR